MTPFLSILLAAVLAPAAAQAAPTPTPTSSPPPVLALTGATVVDPGRGIHAAGMTVLVEGERIAAVFADGERPLPAGTEVRDLAGRFLLPGLIESHTHLMPRFRESREAMYRELERMHASGVVAARHMAGDARVVSEAARNVLSGHAKGPDLYHVAVMGGPEFAAGDPRMSRSSLGYEAGESPWAQAVTEETDLPLAVARAAGSGATALKLYLGFDAELIAVLTAEAHRQGLQVWAHATVFPTRPLEAVRAGVDVLSHACGMAWQDADVDPTPYAAADIRTRPTFDPDLVEADSPEMTALFAEMVRRGTIFEPTLTAHAHPGDDRFGCTPELTAALTRAAHRAGVPLVAGTDYHLPADEPYPALHDEIEALVDDAGLTPTEALVAATLHAARALGKEADYGTVEPGKLASLVVLAEDPSEDIEALRTVVAVVYRGAVSERGER